MAVDLDEVRQGFIQTIEDRLTVLRAEVERYEESREALLNGAATAPTVVPQRRGRPAKTKAVLVPAEATDTVSPDATELVVPKRRGRPPGSGRKAGSGGGNRAEQAFEHVRNHPGARIPEIAESLGIEPNYLYRVMPKLVSEGRVTRNGEGWFVVMATSAVPEGVEGSAEPEPFAA